MMQHDHEQLTASSLTEIEITAYTTQSPPSSHEADRLFQNDENKDVEVVVQVLEEEKEEEDDAPPQKLAEEDAKWRTAATSSPPPPARPSARGKVRFLDGMRGTACILVICHHMGYLKDKNVGAFAVHTFFVLSSFLLTMVLEKKLSGLYEVKASPRRWLLTLVDYLVRRLLRVYPLFFLVAVFLACSSEQNRKDWYFVYQTGDNFSLWKMLTFKPGHRFFVFWTLPLEISYYFVIPVFTMVAIVLQHYWWVPMAPLSAWVIYDGLYGYKLSFMGLLPHLSTFVCGSIAAIIYNRTSTWIHTTGFQFQWHHKLLVRSLEYLFLLLLVSVCFDALVFDYFGPYPFTVKGPVYDGDHFVSVHIAVLIVCEMLLPGNLSKIFEWCVLRYAGKISFSIYLVHPFVIHSDFMYRHQGNYYSSYFMTWILIGIASTISFHLVESPGFKLASYISAKLKAMEINEITRRKGLYEFVPPTSQDTYYL